MQAGIVNFFRGIPYLMGFIIGVLCYFIIAFIIAIIIESRFDKKK